MTEAQIFPLLEEKGVCPQWSSWRPLPIRLPVLLPQGRGALGDPKRLEGYLFPDTYEFYMGEEPVSVLNKMILRFDEIFTDEMRQEVQNDSRTIQDVVTEASMIEGDRRLRPGQDCLGHLQPPGQPHQRDGGLSEHRRHHPLRHRRLTEVDLNADTPYNTRTHKGLTPRLSPAPV